MAKIYIIRNDINDKVYVGKTEFSLEKRFKEHCSDAFKNRCEKRPLYNAMKKYGTEHFYIELIEETDMPEEREMYWIERYGSYVNGYNATMGGDSKKYINYDEVVKIYREVRVQSEVAKILGIDSGHVSSILRAKGEERLSGREVATLLRGKPILMFSIDGMLIKEFDSLSSASYYIAAQDSSRTNTTGIREHIKGVCTGKRQTAYGYKWRFAETA